MHSPKSRREISVNSEVWPLKRPFVIARGAKSDAHVVVVTVTQDGVKGHGESVPYERYGETVAGVVSDVLDYDGPLERMDLLALMPAGAARNALDCALWDLEAKLAGVPVAQLVGVKQPQPMLSAYTLSLGSAEEMADQARDVANLNLLKLKLGGGLDDIGRMQAVRKARPDARLVADANEGWSVEDLDQLVLTAEDLKFELVEQPLKAGDDLALVNFKTNVAICADESVHTGSDLAALKGRYDCVNIKLDKAGGLTEALQMVRMAREMGFGIMIGSMVATSLAVAPALLLSHDADWVDLDGPLLLKEDRPFGVQVVDGVISPPEPRLWG